MEKIGEYWVTEQGWKSKSAMTCELWELSGPWLWHCQSTEFLCWDYILKLGVEGHLFQQ
jgi:hypothetical protein